MADSSLKIVVSAEDQATPALNKIKQAFDQYQKSYETISQFNTRQQSEATALSSAHQNLAAATNQVSTSNQGLFTTFAAASIAANAISSAISFISGQFKESVSAANAYQSALAGLASYAATFGSTAQQATEAVQRLSSDGLLPSINAANALKNLMAGGLNLQDASSLIKTFEDRAAFGRNATIGFGTAVENLSQAFKTEQSRAGDANGMTENFSQILAVGAAQMGKNVDQLTTLERAHAKLIGIQQLSIATEGDAAQYAETAAGQQAKLSYEVTQTQIAFGTALQPAIQLISQSLVDLGSSFNFSGDGMKTAQMFATTLAFSLVNVGNVIIGVAETIVGAFNAIKSGSMQPLEDAMKGSFDRIATGAVNYEQRMQDVAAGAANSQISEANRATDEISAQAAKAAATMAKEIDRENRSFADSMQQRTEQFQQSMTDMIIAHRDKSQSIQLDIASENNAYNDQLTQRQADLNDKLGGLEETHQQKVSDITDKITEEKSRGLVVDGVVYAQANQKKLDALQDEMDKENAAYQRNVDKAQDGYAKDVANDAKKHADKLNALQVSLDAETAILQKHAAEVAAVGDKQKEDDITRLQRTYAEENARAAQQHQQRLADIRDQGNAQGSTYATSLANAQANAMQLKTPDLQKVAADQGAKMSDSMWNAFLQRAQSFFSSLPDWIDKQTGAISGGKAILDYAKNLTMASIPGFGQIMTIAKSLHIPGFASGTLSAPGGMAIVGESGPELVNLPKGSQVYNNQQSQQMTSSSPTVTIGTVINNTQADLSSLARDIGFQIALRT